jgi:mono/diheme cytochrome c family protein
MADAVNLIWIKDRGANLLAMAARFASKCMRPIGRPLSVGLCAAALLMAAIGCLPAQDVEKAADKGRTEYMQNCAGCHGADAKGAGPLSAKLKSKPPDLTLLAKRNHGSFDSAAVYQLIDGRNTRVTHRGAEMPIWGCRHEAPAVPAPTLSKHQRKFPKRVVSAMKRRETELDSLLDLPCGSEEAVRDRILSIVEYLSRLQAK